jgi:hypothetical protein
MSQFFFQMVNNAIILKEKNLKKKINYAFLNIMCKFF